MHSPDVASLANVTAMTGSALHYTINS